MSLKTPDLYEHHRVNLSSHIGKIANLTFDKAIIFFIPKVADKGINPESLSCTIVQVIDRGEWGKEEVSITVDASSLKNRKYREFDLNTDGYPYSLKILPVSGCRLAVLDFYFDPDFNSVNYPMPTNNPINFTGLTPADIAAGVLAASPQLAAQIAAETNNVLTAQEQQKTARSTKDHTFTITAWTGDANNHVILGDDKSRLGLKALNLGNNRVHIDLGDPSGKSFATRDEYIDKNGTFDASTVERTLPLIMYLDANKPSQDVSVTEFFP
jgi:hypothetical protein